MYSEWLKTVTLTFNTGIMCTGGEGSASNYNLYDYIQEQECPTLNCEQNEAYATLPVH